MLRPVRTNEKIKKSSPAVATASPSHRSPAERVFVETVTAGKPEHQVREDRAAGGPGDLGGQIDGEFPATQTVAPAPEPGIRKADHRVEVRPRHRPEHEDERVEPGSSRRGVLQQLEAGVVRRQALGGDPRADDHCDQKPGSQEFGQSPAAHAQAHGRRWSAASMKGGAGVGGQLGRRATTVRVGLPDLDIARVG